jgi:hypothetical protein
MGQQHFLMRRAQDIGGLGHKMDPAKNKKFPVPDRRRLAGEFERITAEIGKPEHPVLHIMMTEDQNAIGQFLFAPGYPVKQGFAINIAVLTADINLEKLCHNKYIL